MNQAVIEVRVNHIPYSVVVKHFKVMGTSRRVNTRLKLCKMNRAKMFFLALSNRDELKKKPKYL